MTVVGVELRPDTAVAVVPGREAVVAVPFDPAAPEGAVAALGAAIGGVRQLHLAIGLGLLDVAPLALPAVPAPVARAIVTTNADRFFLTTAPLAVAVDARQAIGFATPAAALERWVAAFEAWAPVRVIEPAPTAALRALRARGRATAHVLLPAAPGEQGVLDVVDGALARVRRVPLVRGAAELNGARPLAELPLAGIPHDGATAWGALSADPAEEGTMLLSPALAARRSGARRRRLAGALALLVAGLGLAAWGLADRRARTLAALEARIAALTPAAAAPLAARDALVGAAEEARVLAAPPAPSPLAVLAAVSERVPVDVVLQRMAWDGERWELIGTTRNTTAVVTRLSADPRLADVRIAGPTTRYREGGTMLETFTLSLRAAPAPEGGR